MKLKKITSLILLMLLLISSVPSFASEEIANTIDLEAYNETVDFLSSLEIYSFADKKADTVVTRAMFAKMVADLMGISEDYSASDYFTDVTEKTEYSAQIGAMAGLGIMNGVGGGKFSPDAPITYYQAVKTVVTALGYTPAASVAGGYTDGYMRCAYNIGIIENAPYDFNAPITFETAATLIKQSAEAEVYEMVYVSDKKVYYASREDNIALNVYHNIYLGEGVMTDNGITATNGATAVSIDSAKIGDKVFTGVDEKERAFLGYYVEYYYRESDSELLYVKEKKGRNDVVTISAKDIAADDGKFSKTCIVTNVDGKKKNYKLDLYANLIYNGGLDKTFTSETLKIKDGFIRLIDADLDNDYELIIAEEYRDIVFKNCSTEIKKISATYSLDEYAYINYGEYKEAVFTDANGNEIAPDNIKEGSVLSVFRSKNKEKIRFVVSENQQEISADSVETDEDGKFLITHGENKYELSYTFESLMDTASGLYEKPEVASSYKAYINYEGNISVLIKTEGRLQYAYMMAVGPVGTGMMKNDLCVKVHLESDDTVVLPVSKKLTLNGEKNKAGNDILNVRELYDASTGEFIPQLVMIRINSAGELKELDIAVDNRGSVCGFDLANFSLDYHSQSGLGTNSINGVRTYDGNQFISAATKIFVVLNTTNTMQETDEELVKVIDFSTYTRRYGGSYIKMYDTNEAWDAAAIVVSDVTDYQSRLFVVTEAHMQKDFDGEFKQAINGWWTQDFRSFVEAEDGILSNAVKSRYPESDGVIHPGDVFEISFNVSEEINRARMVYSSMRDKNPDYCFFDMNGQTSVNDDSNYYILGYPCYVAKDRIGTYSKANADYTTVSGSRTATAERFWTTILQAPTSSMSVFEFDCETKEIKVISWEEIPTAAQLTASGYDNFDTDTKVLLKRVKGTTYDVMVIRNMSVNY